MIRKFQNWISKILKDSITTALKQSLSIILFGVFTALAGLSIVAITRVFKSTITIPVPYLLIISLFAIIGVLIPVSRIIYIFNDYRKSKSQQPPKGKQKEILQFEDLPREWRTQIWKIDNGWHAGTPQVYCSQHNLRLSVKPYQEDIRDARSPIIVSTHCSDCSKEKIRYRDNWPYGTAFHDSNDWPSFEEEIKNRFIREAESKERNRA